MNIRNAYQIAHFYAGNLYRLLTAPWYQRMIRPEEARSIFGASFGVNGWHHIRKTLEEYDADPGIDYRDTTMYQFLSHFTPSSICELLVNGAADGCELPLFVYPWGGIVSGGDASFKDPSMSRFCGPSSDLFIKDEFERTITLYKKMKMEGYRPWRFGNTFIGGTFLKRINREIVFVVLQGNHRMGVLAHLGWERIAVREVRGHLPMVSECRLKDWSLVKSGQCREDVALKVFEMFFEQDGNHIKRVLSA